MSRRARVSRPVRTSSRSPRPTRADSPCAAMVASRCSVVMANPSGSSPSVPIARPTSSSTPRPAISAGDGLDAGDQVAVAGDDVARAAAVPGDAVVEDVAEAVPLGGGLQRHGDHVVRAADAVREALVAALGVGAGVESSCAPGWCAAASPSAGRRCRSDWASEKLAPAADQGRALRRFASSRKFIVPSTSSSPQRPQFEQRFAAAAMALSGSVRSSGGTAMRPPASVTGPRSVRPVIREDPMGDDGHQLCRYAARS